MNTFLLFSLLITNFALPKLHIKYNEKGYEEKVTEKQLKKSKYQPFINFTITSKELNTGCLKDSLESLTLG